MNIYADRGNIAVLERRCAWRGIGSRCDAPGPATAFDPEAHDLLYIGGGQDRDQALVARDLVETKRDALAAALDRGAAMLAVCGGYQLLGHSYELPDGESLPGLGLVDLRTVREPGPRLIGNVVIEADLGDGPQRSPASRTTAAARTSATAEQPLGRVVSGFGNNGRDGREGVRRGRLIGTYLHGPLLPKNAWLADRLIEWALERALRRARPALGAARRPPRGARPRLAPCARRSAELVSACRVEPKPPVGARGLGRARATSSNSSASDARPRRAARCGRPARPRRARAVRVEQQHPQLAAVAGVDQPRRVHERDSVAGGEARSAAARGRRGPPGSRPRCRCRRSRARRARGARPRPRRGRSRRRARGPARGGTRRLGAAAGTATITRPDRRRRRPFSSYGAKPRRDAGRHARAHAHPWPRCPRARGRPRPRAARDSTAAPLERNAAARPPRARRGRSRSMRSLERIESLAGRAETEHRAAVAQLEHAPLVRVEQVGLVQDEQPRARARADLLEHVVDRAASSRRAPPREPRRRRRAGSGRRSTVSSSVALKASTSWCGSLRMKPTVSVTQIVAALVPERARGRVERLEEPLPHARRSASVSAFRSVDLPAFV